MSKNRLTPQELDLYPEYLDDHLQLLMHHVERALLAIGAEPGKDYTYKDLMSWAVELSDSNIYKEFKVDWTPKNQMKR